jgi:serine/threonine-protein kinase RsbW
MDKSIIIQSDLGNIKPAVDEIICMLKRIGTDESDIFDIRLCLEEALINAIKYGNKLDKKKPVRIDFSYHSPRLAISVEDTGSGFDLSSVPDPTTDDNILKGSGRGVFLIKHLMDSIEPNGKGNRITMIKNLKPIK